MIAEVALGLKATAALALSMRRELRPAAALLGLGAAADGARRAVQALVLAPARAAGRLPYAGAARACFHAEQALFLAWPFGVAALAWWSWRRQSLALLPAWAACSAAAALAYPALRGERLGLAYAAVTAGCALASLLAVALRRERARAAQLASLLLVAGECATLAGPYLARPFAFWWVGQATWALTFAALGAIAWRSAWKRAA